MNQNVLCGTLIRVREIYPGFLPRSIQTTNDIMSAKPSALLAFAEATKKALTDYVQQEHFSSNCLPGQFAELLQEGISAPSA